MPPRKHREAERLYMDGFLATLRGRYDLAISYYRGALSIDSTFGSAAFGLVHALTKEKKFNDVQYVRERIRQEFERQNLNDTQFMLDFHLMTAQVLTEEDSLQAGLAACENALQYSRAVTRGGVYRQIAEIYLRLHDYEPALDACEEALANNPNYPQALLTLTRVYHTKGDVQMTVEIGGRLLALWRDADPDFLDFIEVQRILGRKAVL
jgi:tetratricopeptide (TPR) repeat protein